MEGMIHEKRGGALRGLRINREILILRKPPIEVVLRLIHVSCVTSHFSSSRVQLSIGIIYEMCLCLIYFGVSGTNCTCEKASINIEAK